MQLTCFGFLGLQCSEVKGSEGAGGGGRGKHCRPARGMAEHAGFADSSLPSCSAARSTLKAGKISTLSSEKARVVI